MTRKTTRRLFLISMGTIGSGCLRFEDNNSDATSGGNSLNGKPTSEKGRTVSKNTESIGTDQELDNVLFNFEYRINTRPASLSIKYVDGIQLQTDRLFISINQETATWTDLNGSTKLKPNKSITLDGSLGPWSWPIQPAVSISLSYDLGDSKQKLAAFNTGGASPMEDVDAKNTGFNEDVVGAPNIGRVWSKPLQGRLISQPSIYSGSVYYGLYSREFHARQLSNAQEQWQFISGRNISRTPAVSEQAVYIGTGNNSKGFKLDRENGEPIWETRLGTYSPTLFDGVLYSNALGKVYANNANSGDQLWVRDLDTRDGAPAVTKNSVVVGVRQGVTCLNRENGRKKWVAIDERIEAPPNPTIAGNIVLTTGGQGSSKIIAFDLENGQERWNVDIDEGHLRYSPAVAGDTVYIASNQNSLRALSIADGSEHWKTEIDALHQDGRLSVTESHIYLPTAGAIVGIDRFTGNQTWSIGNPPTCSPAVADGYIVFATKEDEQHVLMAYEERV